jgi:heme/copper-type cytochrome/quinol oxidase subunit 3
LALAGMIRRITRGLYDKPSLNALTGKSTHPDPRSVIDALARRDSARMIVDGITAANDIGLSDAVPAHIIVHTDARLKSHALGSLTIHFKKTAPSKLLRAGRPAMRVVQVLHWLRDTLQSDAPRVRRRLQSIFADPVHGSGIAPIFAASQHQPSEFFGLANALILITSSWAMVKAIEAVRHCRAPRAHKWLTLCLATAGLFCVNKLFEYGIKIDHGITPATNSFFTFYYVITGLHFTHVVGGMVFILHCRNHALAETGTTHYLKKIENTGLFWHFVDVLWLVIFPMLYLVGLR